MWPVRSDVSLPDGYRWVNCGEVLNNEDLFYSMSRWEKCVMSGHTMMNPDGMFARRCEPVAEKDWMNPWD